MFAAKGDHVWLFPGGLLFPCFGEHGWRASATELCKSQSFGCLPVGRPKRWVVNGHDPGSDWMEGLYHIRPYLGGSSEQKKTMVLGIIFPTDFHIFQRGRYTTNQIFSGNIPFLGQTIAGATKIWVNDSTTKIWSPEPCESLVNLKEIILFMAELPSGKLT